VELLRGIFKSPERGGKALAKGRRRMRRDTELILD
jgi:hypothetical protein